MVCTFMLFLILREPFMWTWFVYENSQILLWQGKQGKVWFVLLLPTLEAFCFVLLFDNLEALIENIDFFLHITTGNLQEYPIIFVQLINLFWLNRFCYMKPFEGCCEIPEKKVEGRLITLSAKRSGYNYSDSTESKGLYIKFYYHC